MGLLTEILNEEYSISDEVMNTSKNITNNLIDLFYSTETNKFGEKYFEMHFDEPIFGIIKHIYCVSREVENCKEGSQFRGDEILIEVPSANGELYTEHLYMNISHELEHVFQLYMTKSNGSIYRTSNLYKIALNYLNDEDIVVRTVAKLIYRLNQKETDAFCHEYYSEYMIFYKNNIKLDKNDLFVETKLKGLEKLYNLFKSFDKNEINSILIEKFNKTYGDLDYFFRHGFKYLKYKLKNVEKKVKKYSSLDEDETIMIEHIKKVKPINKLII